MSDCLTRLLADSGDFFALACTTTAAVNEACRRHDAGPLAAVALGRALTGAVLLAALLKDGQQVQLKFEGSGPLGKIICEAGYDGWLRGYVGQPQAEAPLRAGRISVAEGLGRAGFLTVTKDIGMPQPYRGMVQLYTSEIGEDIAFYLLESEQKPSIVALATYVQPDGTVAAAGGFLIQPLPQADETVIAAIETAVGCLPPLSELLHQGASADSILARLFTAIPHHRTASQPLRYQCSCSQEKMQAALAILGAGQLRQMIAENHGSEVFCEFCRHSYLFSTSDLQALLTRVERAA